MIGLLAIIGGLVVYLAATQLPWRRSGNPKLEKYNATRGEFARLQYTTLSGRRDVEEAMSGLVITALGSEAEGMVTDLQREALREILTTAIHTYCIAETPEPYKQWRISQGGRFRGMDEINVVGLIEDFRRSPGAESLDLRTPTSVEDAFDQIFLGVRVIDQGVNRAEAISTSPEGLQAIVYRVQMHVPPPRVIPGGLSETAWVGGSVQSGMRFFDLDKPFEQALRESGELLVAECSIALEFTGEIQRPIWFSAYWSESRGDWILYEILQTNTPYNRLTWVWMH